jgi:hypothetical protein
MPVQGSVTSATSGSSVTLPSSGLTIVGVACQKHTIGGFLTIQLDSTRTALLPFSAQRGVTTLDVPVNQSLPGNMWHVHFTATGLKLLYTGTGLTSGTFFFYYGTPFSDSQVIDNFSGIEVDITTTSPVSFTFPTGNIRITGLMYEAGYNTAETNVNTDFSWNTSSGRSIDINVANKDPLTIIPLEEVDGSAGLKAAQTLSVTVAFDGTHVATGRLILYYRLT